MKQYCRYCAYAVYGDVVWCDELDKIISESSAKTPNNCKSFAFCELDVFNPERKYKSREVNKDEESQILLF